jgi:hypothetical protein
MVESESDRQALTFLASCAWGRGNAPVHLLKSFTGIPLLHHLKGLYRRQIRDRESLNPRGSKVVCWGQHNARNPKLH